MTAGKVAVALTLLAGFAAAPVLADNRNTAAAVAAQDRFATPLTLRGTLGDAQIEMHLQQKPDPSEGIQGSYVIAGQSAKILLAGESDNADILMEESVNGKDVSGEWAGKLVGNTFSGTWSTTDDAVTKPFALTIQATRAVK
jgi:hypothetical protein